MARVGKTVAHFLVVARLRFTVRMERLYGGGQQYFLQPSHGLSVINLRNVREIFSWFAVACVAQILVFLSRKF